MSAIDTVVVHFDGAGEIAYHVVGGSSVRLLIVDDRAPHDRVYEYLSRSDAAEVKALLATDAIGSSQDARHEAVAARVTASGSGARHLALVPTHEGEGGR